MKIANINKSIGITREELPQIDFEKFNEVFLSLETDQIPYKNGTATANKLKPSQDQLNISKIEKMVADKKHEEDRTLFVSKEGYIIDGHHYWAARVTNDPQSKINVVMIDMSIVDLVNWFNDQDFTHNKKITESKGKK